MNESNIAIKSTSRVEDSLAIYSYHASFKIAWNELVSESSNGTFLHYREFIEYHGSRFTEQSILCFRADELLAVLPLEGTDTKLYSYRGLSYGGWIWRKGLNPQLLIQIIQCSLDHLKSAGVRELIIGSVPAIFCTTSQDTYHQIIQKLGGTISKTKDYYYTSLPGIVQDRGKIWGVKKAQDLGVELEKSENLIVFWENVLIPCLEERHNAKPVHSLQEILLLKSVFPSNISLYLAKLDDEILAGTVLFQSGATVHAQYTASTIEGKKCRALDALFVWLIEEELKEYHCLSLGTAILPTTAEPDLGLIQWKESLGAKSEKVNDYLISL